MAPTLSDLEAEPLRKVLNGEAFTMPSQQRVRLELLGVIRDRPSGIVVTPEGRRLATASLRHEFLKMRKRPRTLSPGIAAADECPFNASPSFERA